MTIEIISLAALAVSILLFMIFLERRLNKLEYETKRLNSELEFRTTWYASTVALKDIVAAIAQEMNCYPVVETRAATEIKFPRKQK